MVASILQRMTVIFYFEFFRTQLSLPSLNHVLKTLPHNVVSLVIEYLYPNCFKRNWDKDPDFDGIFGTLRHNFAMSYCNAKEFNKNSVGQ